MLVCSAVRRGLGLFGCQRRHPNTLGAKPAPAASGLGIMCDRDIRDRVEALRREIAELHKLESSVFRNAKTGLRRTARPRETRAKADADHGRVKVDG
jgi:hypothetical protein